MWGATTFPRQNARTYRDFNPRAPCGARLACDLYVRGLMTDFNPRAPCGARPPRSSAGRQRHDFNPRAPCGARREKKKRNAPVKIFQSTRPVWGATRRSPRQLMRLPISIHAPRVGRDTLFPENAVRLGAFQSTRPVWGATANLTILPRQICTKGTKEFLLGRKTHGKKEK